MQTLTQVTPILIVAIFLTSLLIVPSVFVLGGNNTLTNIDGPFESQALLSQMPYNARVAIYDEDNLTVPAMSLAENLTNNIAEITTLLEGAGHSVEALTTDDILNHELLTADYDVFIIVNNIPRPSIFNHVKEFWLGGGSLLSFNGAMSYLWLAEILYPGWSGDPRYGSWNYLPSVELNVTARHPTMKDFHVNETVTHSANNWAVIAQTAIDGADNAYYYTTLLNNASTPNHVSAFAIDSGYKGGRVVQLPGDGSSISADFQSIIIDSVEWLVPKPKGRIVIDYAHQPRIGVDPWDDEFVTVVSSVNNFKQFRTLAVNHTFTFDKLYPSASGNLTADRLAPYDVLILVYPDLNYTSAEMTAVENWVSGGGSLLVLGDRTGMIGPNRGDITINNLLQNFDMSLGTSNILGNALMDPETHVTLENSPSITCGNRNYVNVIGSAVPIWTDAGNVVIAAQEFGSGRVILSGEMNVFDTALLSLTSNAQYSINVLNWLTAADADILVFTSYGYHRADAITALRDLGHSYQPLYTDDYIDNFIDSKDWGLVILDQSNFWFSNTELDAIYAYINAGGKLILSYFDVDDTSTHPVWSKIGVEYSADAVSSPDLLMWDSSHRIFTDPNNLDAANLTSNIAFGDSGDTLTVLSGYTALAGSSATEQAGNAYIVLSNDYQTLYNGYLIDACTGDEDDSTYRDSVELWQNEIAFMLNPPGGLPFNLDPMTLLIIGVGVLAVVVIGAVVYRTRGGGSSSKPKKKSTKKKK
ncbi:MAG: hypothetical protein ThorAB25_17490 [Candidatus Thorarchaeota archaeon AB_25]|nr:MAG: hypothetical protein ThorAB25_17490 [Candidatus Thorarchaeota archaeon AB_25]